MAAFGCILTGLLYDGSAQAQALIDFVNDPATGATQLQQQVGTAVQRTCSQLGAEGGTALTNAPKRDLYLRCNEMVQTANAFLGRPGTVRSLGYTDRDQLLATLQQVSGEEISTQASLTTQVSAGQFANISGRLNALRLGGASASGSHVARLDKAPGGRATDSLVAGRSDLLPALGYGASADSVDAASNANPVGWFMESSYGFGDQDQTAAEDAFDFDSVSVSTGADYNFGSGVAGISFGFDDYKADFDQATLVSGGDVEVKGISGSLFGGWFGQRWSLSAIGTYGTLESEVTRRTRYVSQNASCPLGCGADRMLTGDPDGSFVALGATLAYELSLGGWDVTPSLSASYRDMSIDGFTEQDSSNGGLAFQYGEQSIKSTRSIVGLALSRPISQSFGVLVPALRLEWQHEFEDDVRSLEAKYAADDSAACASCFVFVSGQPEADFGVASLGLSAVFTQRMQVYLVYEAVLGVADLSSSSIAAGLRGQF